MFSARDIIFTTVVPFGVALAVLLAAWRPWRRGERASRRGYWGGAVAVGGGFLAAFVLLDGRPQGWPPAEARHWLFYLAAALTLLGVIESLVQALAPRANWLRAEAALLVFAAGAYFLFQSLLRDGGWTPVQAGCHLLLSTVLLHAAWASSEVLVLRLPRPAGPLVLTVFAGGVALVVMLSGSLVYGRLAGALAAATLAAVAVAAAAPAFSLARGGVTVVAPLAVAILQLGHHLVDPGVTHAHVVLLLAGLLLPWVAVLPPLRRRRPWVRMLAATVLAVVPVAIAVLLAQRAFVRMQQETGPGTEAGLYGLRAAQAPR
jgi:hypothetical protein